MNETLKKLPIVLDASEDICVGKLPPLFPNGLTKNAEEWAARRRELLDAMVPVCYGGMPPKPEVFRLDELYSGSYMITAGTKERTVSFEMSLRLPKGEGPFPVLINGDGCFHYVKDNVASLWLEHGFAIAQFNRVALAKDVFSFDRTHGLYAVYPELGFGALSAWAWGYHRAVDAMMELPCIDKSCICISGHSRGGKTTLLAGATDERIAFTHASGAGCFGTGCFRYTQKSRGDDTRDGHAETLENMLGEGVPWDSIGFWFGREMDAYKDREQDLPFDSHFLKAAVAPRGLLETGSVEDVWANPRGDYQTFRAAKEAFRAAGAEENLASVYRYGAHGCFPEDFAAFLQFVETRRAGNPFLLDNADRIFGRLESIYDEAK